MKFTKKQAYENIVAQLTPNGETLSLSERSINDQLETLIPLLATEETELADFVKSCFPIFKTANANVNNDVSRGIKKYKEEHPEPTNPTEPTNPDDTKSELEKRLAEMEKKFAEQEKAGKIVDVKKKLSDALKAKGVKNEAWLDFVMNETTIDVDCDIEEKAETLLKSYNKFVASVDPCPVPGGGAGSGSGSQSLDKAIEEAAKLAKNRLSY